MEHHSIRLHRCERVARSATDHLVSETNWKRRYRSVCCRGDQRVAGGHRRYRAPAAWSPRSQRDAHRGAGRFVRSANGSCGLRTERQNYAVSCSAPGGLSLLCGGADLGGDHEVTARGGRGHAAATALAPLETLTNHAAIAVYLGWRVAAPAASRFCNSSAMLLVKICAPSSSRWFTSLNSWRGFG